MIKPSPETVLAIIIGASEYPHIPSLSNIAFSNSAARFAAYLTDRDGFALPGANLLNLFNSTAGTAEQNDSMTVFLQTRIDALSNQQQPASDLLVYYVGHGTFVDPYQRYILAVKNIKTGTEEISGFPMATLSNTLKEHAAHLRRFLILDCCFSASAFKEFQLAGALELARQKTQDSFPKKGTALLCASGPTDAAKAPSDLDCTMFSGALLETLQTGSTQLSDVFSLSDLGLYIQNVIQQRFSEKGVRPEVLSPDQRDGDVAMIPLFPNPGLRHASVRKDLSRIDGILQSLVDTCATLTSESASINERLSKLSVIDAGRQREGALGTDTAETSPDAATLRRERLERETGLTKAEWDALPRFVKRSVMLYKRRLRIGRYWLYGCMAFALTDWTLLVAEVTLGHNTVVSEPIAAGVEICTIICAVPMFLDGGFAVARLLFRRRFFETPLEHAGGDAQPWESYDVVVEAESQRWRDVFGLQIDAHYMSIASIISLVTCVAALAVLYIGGGGYFRGSRLTFAP